MHNELTKVDIEKMKAELAEREAKLPAQHEEVKRTREYGDLSENDEYRCAKRELNSNRSRIRYLQNMINTAVVISTESAEGVVGLFDWVEIYLPEDDETRTVRIVTTMRVNASLDAVSKESPFGRALLGHKVGDRVEVHASADVSYFVVIKSIRKGADDDSLPISSF